MLESFPPKTPSHLVVFDGTCVFCSGFVRFIVNQDKKEKFYFVTAQSDLGQDLYRTHNLDPNDLTTNIVIVKDEAFTKTAAFAKLMSELGWPWRALAIVRYLPRTITDRAYDLVARNRYRFGRHTCPMPSAALKARLLA